MDVTPAAYGQSMAMKTTCPCGCGRTYPISAHQMRDILHNQAMPDVDMAITYGLPVTWVRHIRVATGAIRRTA
jgi:hypothetical protein